MSESVGRLIRERRQQLGITQEQFALLLGAGVRQAEVSRLECGVDSWPERLQDIAKVLDFCEGELLMQTAGANPAPGASESVPAIPHLD